MSDEFKLVPLISFFRTSGGHVGLGFTKLELNIFDVLAYLCAARVYFAMLVSFHHVPAIGVALPFTTDIFTSLQSSIWLVFRL